MTDQGKIVEYTLVGPTADHILIETVNKMLKQGWILYGDVVVSMMPDGRDRVAQAMVKVAT